MEDFYRFQRQRLDLLVEGDRPVGGRWSFDEENREPPPKGAQRLDVPPPYRPREDDIDAQVREDLDRWERDEGLETVGRDGPRLFARRGVRRSRRSSGSSPRDWGRSDRTRTPCSAATGRWPTACSRRR
jgi:hypothetical protein